MESRRRKTDSPRRSVSAGTPARSPAAETESSHLFGEYLGMLGCSKLNLKVLCYLTQFLTCLCTLQGKLEPRLIGATTATLVGEGADCRFLGGRAGGGLFVDRHK